MMRIVSYQVADNLNIKKFRSEYQGELVSSSSFELFYKYKSSYFYLLSYGVVVFCDVDTIDQNNLILLIKKFSDHTFDIRHKEDFIIEKTNSDSPVFSYNSLSVPEITADLIRIVMLHVGQSTVLDYYQEKSQILVDQIQRLTSELENFGKLKTSKKNLLKIIGKTLSTQSKIIDDLYILDAPPETWDNELLGKVNDGLAKLFDINLRFREVEYILKNVQSNLAVFIELINTRQTHFLEWVVIILIFIEVINIFIAPVFH
jgi:uncharacterized Rmd1/YagE family protein